jgi:hypothetical protein
MNVGISQERGKSFVFMVGIFADASMQLINELEGVQGRWCLGR